MCISVCAGVCVWILLIQCSENLIEIMSCIIKQSCLVSTSLQYTALYITIMGEGEGEGTSYPTELCHVVALCPQGFPHI